MKTKPQNFPIIVQRGSSIVKIYRDETKASGIYYRVTFYKGGKRCRVNFTDLAEAKAEAEAKAAQLSRGDLEALHINGRDRLIYGRALEAIRPLNLQLDEAALEFVEAKKIMDGRPLTEAARFYMRHHGRGIQRKMVKEAVAEMIAAKTQKGVSATYLADLRYRLGSLGEKFQCSVNDITSEDMRTFLDGLGFTPRGFNNTYASVRTFFSFAQDRGWLSREADLLSGIEKRQEKDAPIEIYTPAEMAEILSHCSLEMRPCMALAAFAGLRSEEILRLDWSDIERRPGFIEIAAAKAKTASRRLIPIAPNLTQWLAISDKGNGRVWPHSKPWFFESQRDTVDAINAAREKKSKKAAKFAWKANALRHSFISYRLAEIQDVNRVALEAGNSPRMIFQHYRELCTPDESKTWFALLPEDATKVISLTAQL